MNNLFKLFVILTLISCVDNSANALKKNKVSTTNIKNPIVIMKTNYGDIEIELFSKKAPISAKNFLAYAKKGFYNKTVFHRVIDGFMIQGGGFTSDMKEKTTMAPIQNEANNGLENEVGTLAMARTQVINSATSQFFINVNNNGFLNHKNTTPKGYGYAVFGKVIKGMTVINRIKKVKTAMRQNHRDVPVDAVEIVEIKEKI